MVNRMTFKIKGNVERNFPTVDKNYHPDFKCNIAVHTTVGGAELFDPIQKRQSVFIAIWWLSAEAQ